MYQPLAVYSGAHGAPCAKSLQLIRGSPGNTVFTAILNWYSLSLRERVREREYIIRQLLLSGSLPLGGREFTGLQ